MDPTIALAAVRAFAEPPHIDEATAILAAAPLHAIGVGFTSSAYVLGTSGEGAMIARLSSAALGLPVVAPGRAALDALSALGTQRAALIDPPWFDARLNELGRAYYQSAGLEVVFSSPCQLTSDQASIQPQALFDWIRERVPGSAEAIVVGGNGFRAVGVIEALEAATGRLVLTANQVLLWASLRVLGAATEVTGYGRLFSEAVA